MATALETLETQLGAKWAAIRATRQKTEDVLGRLSAALADLHDASCSVVVTGSLGRAEFTEGSDADWLLLVDGPSDPEHAMLAREIERRVLQIVPKEVGPTGTFGSIVASHELVHYIAGTHDSNENLTRRILLLSESRALTNPLVRERVIRNILARYVLHDRSVRSKSGRRQVVPHFLLNDVVRYWRTIASDYASKMWERDRDGWGIRNVKLRFSRKLLFIWGLLAAFAGELFAPAELHHVENDDQYFLMLADLIRSQTDVSPLELLARVVVEAGDKDVADDIFSSYDQFLNVLADPDARKKLEAVRFEDALDESTYSELRRQPAVSPRRHTPLLRCPSEAAGADSRLWSVLMKPIGFSTGALAKGDFAKGLKLQRDVSRIDAVELSALRDHELPTLVAAIPTLDLDEFEYVSFHAPSKLQTLDEQSVFDLLLRLPESWPVVVHPELLQTPSLWLQLGKRLCLENMDNRKTTGRTIRELHALFDAFPEATFCLDLGHARQIDPTMVSAMLMLQEFGDRLVELHISEVGPHGEHLPLGATARQAFARLVHLVPADCPLIIESIIAAESIERELDAVSALFDAAMPHAAIA